MTVGWPFRLAIAAAVLGSVLLALCFHQYQPTAHWHILTRAQLIERARQVSQHFGLDAAGRNAFVVPALSAHPGPQVSPLSVRIAFPANQDDQAAEVGLDSAGLPLYWRAPEGFKPSQTFATDEAAAAFAFQFLAGPSALQYNPPVRRAGDESHEQTYTWKLAGAPHASSAENITVLIKDAVVKTAQHKPAVSSGDDDDDAAPGDNRTYWNILQGIFGFVSTAVTVFILAIYVLWLARRAVNHRFPFRIAIASLALMVVALLIGAPAERLHSAHRDEGAGPVFAAFFLAAAILCFTAVGRGISLTARPKWISLEQLCLLAPLAKATGKSMASGLLLSPLMVAIPFAVVACRLFPNSHVLPINFEVFYSRSPLIDSLQMPPLAYLLGCFGFGVPALRRFIKSPRLAWLLIAIVGAVFFAVEDRAVSGNPAAPLVAGALTLALFCFAYVYFDLLAVLTLQLAAGLLLTLLLLTQNGHPPWTVLAALSGLPLLAYWLYHRGQIRLTGDPSASIPALSGFRAEREKLLAEFSVARRAQQGMLPQTPPSIPGYSIAASCTPSLEVGGDLYDFLRLPDGRLGIGVADVSGKGVPAALYMTLTKGLLASVSQSHSDIGGVIQEVNRHLYGVTRKKVFVTMALGFLDMEKRLLQCARAGHNPVVWRRSSLAATTLVAPTGLGLGITASRVFATQLKVAEMPLNHGDAVVFYSDGITEAMNSSLEQFGEERLMRAVEKTDGLPAAASRDSILAEVMAFLDGVHPQDDMTIVVLRVESPDSSALVTK